MIALPEILQTELVGSRMFEISDLGKARTYLMFLFELVTTSSKGISNFFMKTEDR